MKGPGVIPFVFRGLREEYIFDLTVREGNHEPYVRLQSDFEKDGLSFHSFERTDLDLAVGAVFWDVPGPARERGWKERLRKRFGRTFARDVRDERDVLDYLAGGPNCPRVLILGEPPAVYPRNWEAEHHADFHVVLTWNDDLARGDRYRKFCWPVAGTVPPLSDPPFEMRKLLVNISANKSSSHPRELYSARRAAIRVFEREEPEGFDLFGPGWGDPSSSSAPWPSWRGTCGSKWDVLPRYRFALTYENMRDEPGWITEKIFDALRAGVVPVYWGASNIESFVDPGTYIDRGRFDSDGDLVEHLRAMGREEWIALRDAGRCYLESESFALFSPASFSRAVREALSTAAQRAGGRHD
jgi:hypothetical protein